MFRHRGIYTNVSEPVQHKLTIITCKYALMAHKVSNNKCQRALFCISQHVNCFSQQQIVQPRNIHRKQPRHSIPDSILDAITEKQGRRSKLHKGKKKSPLILLIEFICLLYFWLFRAYMTRKPFALNDAGQCLVVTRVQLTTFGDQASSHYFH